MFKVMFYGGLALAVICLILSVALFIRNDVAKLIGDLTGWNARKAIKKINKKGTEKVSKTEAIKTEVSQVLIRSASTTGTLQTATNTSGLLVRKKKEKAPRRRWSKRLQEEKTDILKNPSVPYESEKEVFQAEENLIVSEGSGIAQTGPKREETQHSIFETGNRKLIQENGTGVLTEDETSVLNAENEFTGLLTEEATDLLQGENSKVLLAAEDTTDILNTENAKDILSLDETTDLLTMGDATVMLLEEEATDLLAQGETTSVLVDEEATDILEGEESTSILRGRSTDVLYGEEESTILLTEDADTIMKEATTVLATKEKPMPAIFDVEDEAMVVHTEESIGDSPEEEV